jgi:CRISPR-associated endonuclease/helicase Cas3
MTFPDFFEALWSEDPFPWQIALAEKIEQEGVWPSPLGLPTAAGKTSVIDLATFALAMGWACAARRIFFIVDRRIVVDEAGERARRIAQRLLDAEQEGHPTRKRSLIEIRNKLISIGAEENCPLLTSTLRGGQLRDDAWTRTPIQPTVCCSTVDQIGSRLLFRGYGCSAGARPIHAALVAYDSLLILDEVHLSNPFAETLDLIASTERPNRYMVWAEERLPKPLQRIELSATPGKATAFTHSKADVEHEILGPRFTRPKYAALKKCDGKKLVAEIIASAEELAGDSPKVVGIIVNRVSTARKVFEEIIKKTKSAKHLLLTGRVRPLDRDALWKAWKPKIEARWKRPAPEKIIYVVATQCVEAGANIDFDALVTEAASLDALRQRFGRLNRLGNHKEVWAVIVADEKEIEVADDSARKPHPVYGSALALTWRWLNAQLDKNGAVNFAHESISRFLPAIEKLKPLLTPAKHAAILLPAHLDALCQTQPEPVPSPDVSVFLHGSDSDPPDVNIVWRELLDYMTLEDEEAWLAAVSACRPSSLEMLSVPFLVARGWLAGEMPDTGADVEGASSPADKEEASSSPRLPVLCWRGEEKSVLIKTTSELRELRSGDTIVVPASRGCCDKFGWNPVSLDSVADLSEIASLRARGRPLLYLASRSHLPDVASLIALLEAEERDYDAIKAALEKIAEMSGLPEAMKESVAFFAQKPQSFEVLRTRENGPVLALRCKFRLKRKVTYPEQESALLSDDQSSQSGTIIELECHQTGVAERAKTFAKNVLPDTLATVLESGGRYHDVGKADPRFQIWLRGGNKILAAGKPLLAKGERLSRSARNTARLMSGYPEKTRHEFMSVALLHANVPKGIDELSFHLIASHHGHARSLASVAPDKQPVTVQYVHNGWQSSASSAHNLASIGSGVCERFWSLTRLYGWWGLAYLETILRLADHRQSEAEQENAKQ